jgi:CheY-like chemotaxis protein
LLTVINDILDFSKIEAGKIDLDVVEFDLRERLEAAMKTMVVRADEKKLELLCDIAPEVPEIVRADPNRLRQVIVNLIGNAIKFTAAGEVRLKVSSEGTEGKECCLHCTVLDSGIGIPKDKQAAIFDAFSQADTSTTRKYGGTGLGLTICARLVSMMGGKMWVESEVARGSQFHFTVRVGIAEAKKTAVKAPATAAEVLTRFSLGSAQQPSTSLHVLVAEDNAVNQRLVVRLLEKRGHRIEIAGNGREALAALEKTSFDLVLMDVQMPEMDGLEATTAIRERERSRGCHQPIIALTAHAMKGDREKCLVAGMDGYLTKPIRPEELDEILKSYTERPIVEA